MSDKNAPPAFPLQKEVAKFNYKLHNGKGKLSDVWLQLQYQKLSLKSETVLDAKEYRESRKREYETDLNGDESTIPSQRIITNNSVSNHEDMQMIMSDNDNESNMSNNATYQPPKRRLTHIINDNINDNIATFNQLRQPEIRSNDNQSRSNDHAHPRTPTAMQSPSHTPVSDFEEMSQTLPLPSPSASPVQDVILSSLKLNNPHSNNGNNNTNTSQAIANQFDQFTIPRTQGELVDLIVNFSGYLNETNNNHLIFRLLQNCLRSSLSTFSGLIHNSLKRDLISNLPIEITNKILGYLDHKTLINLSSVCKNWFRIINNPHLWIKLLQQDKLITNESTITQELSNTKQLVEDWCEDVNTSVNSAQILYKKRWIIYDRWMNPKFKPKRITVKGHGSKVVTCLQHDDEKIVTGIDDKAINIYSTKTGKLIRVLDGHEGGVWALKYTGDTLVTGSTDKMVRIWNMRTGQCTHIFRGHRSTIRCLDIIHPTVIGKDVNGNDIIFPQFPILVTGSRDHNIHVWKLPIANDDEIKPTFDCNENENPYLIAVLAGHTQSVRSVSGYGNIIVSGSYDSTVRVWDLLDNGRCKHVLTGHQDRVYSTTIDFQSKTCFSGSMDATINVWNFETGVLLNTLEGHNSLVGLLNLVDGVLVSAAADSSLRIWDPKTGEMYSKLEGHTTAITCFEHDGLRVVSGSQTMLKLWDVNKGKFARDLLSDVSGGIWQVRIDYMRCVAAVQRFNTNEEDETFIEILDFSEPPNKITNIE